MIDGSPSPRSLFHSPGLSFRPVGKLIEPRVHLLAGDIYVLVLDFQLKKSGANNSFSLNLIDVSTKEEGKCKWN